MSRTRAERRAALDKARKRHTQFARMIGMDEMPKGVKDRHPADCGRTRCWVCHAQKLADKRRDKSKWGLNE